VNQLTQELRLAIDEGDRWSGNLLVDGTVNGVVDQGLVVGGDPKSDGTVDATWNDALREREGDRD
jgi:hypothetical protein